MECATLDDSLRFYTQLCCVFRETLRHWGRAVFAGRVVFDPEVERIWRAECGRLFSRASEVLERGKKAEVECFTLEGLVLEDELKDLERLQNGWVSPRLAVGPAARHPRALSPQSADEVRRRIQSLPALPADWKPMRKHGPGWLRKLWKRLTS
jgi:hypothetical protein